MQTEGFVGRVRLGLLELSSAGSAELGARLTCLTLLLSPIGDWYIRPIVLCLSAAGLLFRSLWRSRWLWLGLAVLTNLRALLDWPLADNHAYLLGYWCLAVAIATWYRDLAPLSRNARLLIGLTFAFAAWQKWTTPNYTQDVFFLTTFLLDQRFEDFVVLLTSLTYDQIDAARHYLEADYRLGPPSAPLPFEIPLSLVLLARVSTWWNLLDQALVAGAFLVPPTFWLGRVRNGLLILFCFVTYAVAPVASFGWLLLSMGITQSSNSLSIRLWYLIAFAAVIFYYEVPWARVLVDLLGAE